ncbi:Hint domain-containing protein, partial [Halocynthiibacter sp. C4]|uniref:Hint domain-containing protein n=1 Tax=Halocynthiibacter sp. C4 TaxID=2992758 RepID=UPI00237B0EF7
YNGDTITYGNGKFVTGVTFYTSSGGRYFIPDDGQTIRNGRIDDTSIVTSSTNAPVGDLETTPPCFVAGTLILTDRGEVLVEELTEGDRVITRDNGPQPIRWIQARKVSGQGSFAPVLIKAGALGNTRDLLVSPQHRMLLDDWRAELFLGEETALCSAIGLCNDSTITRAPQDSVTYIHLMFDQHEIIYAEGAPTESFFVGDFLTSKDSATYQEIASLFPELAKNAANWKTASRVAKGAEMAVVRNAAGPLH